MSIPNEAVEAAAKAFIEHGTLLEALETAAPYMLAGAWDEGMEAMYESTSHEWPPIPEANPYRSQA